MNTIRTAVLGSLTAVLVIASASASETSLVIEGCSVFETTDGRMLPNRTIVIRGDTIAAVTGPDERADIPADAVRIDGRGKFAIPGLIDAHVHVVHVLDFAHLTDRKSVV